MKVIIACAGTAGHINPGIAIANKIKEKNSNADIMFIGTNRGLESDLITRAGYKLKTIDAYGLSKKISIETVKNNIKTLKSIKQAEKIIKEINPNIVIGTGGYICGPVFLAAKKYKIPTILHESNAFPGKAVKMLAKKTNKILVGFEDAKERLEGLKNVIVTGNPTKMQGLEFTEQKKDEIKKSMDLDEKLKTVLIFGGSQGAEAINNSIIDIVKNKIDINYQIVWATGQKQYQIIKEKLLPINIDAIEKVKVFPYIYNMEELMNMADLIICRSGAMTITEIANVGKPAIFIPLPNVSQNHQERNAEVLEKIGAARIILNKNLNSNTLIKTIEEIFSNDYKQMGELAKKIKIDNVEEKIYKEIENLL